MDTPSLGNYASVEDLPYTERKMTFNRGYGNIVVVTEGSDNKVNTKSVPYNRLQPLVAPFGDHAPVTADPEFKLVNPQTNLAWAVTKSDENMKQ